MQNDTGNELKFAITEEIRHAGYIAEADPFCGEIYISRKNERVVRGLLRSRLATEYTAEIATLTVSTEGKLEMRVNGGWNTNEMKALAKSISDLHGGIDVPVSLASETAKVLRGPTTARRPVY